METGNFTSLGIYNGFGLFSNDVDAVARLFRFIPLNYPYSGVYRIISQFFGPTRSLVFDSNNNYLGFNQTNNTLVNQHWYVGVTDHGSYVIMPYAETRMYLTVDPRNYKITVEDQESFCAWSLIEEGDFIGARAPKS